VSSALTVVFGLFTVVALVALLISEARAVRLPPSPRSRAVTVALGAFVIVYLASAVIRFLTY
jgi:hypothetical protein